MLDRRNDIIEDLKTRLDLIEGMLDDGDEYPSGGCARCKDIREIINGTAEAYHAWVRAKIEREMVLKRQLAKIRENAAQALKA